jgi:CRISPR-associated protein Csm1
MKNMNQLFALAGLLHDIGKFGQRADIGFDYSKDLDVSTKKMADVLCNLTQGGYFSHQHVIWTHHFLAKFENLWKEAELHKIGDETLLNISAAHHKPNTFNEAIITLADHWSSGIDRNSQFSVERDVTYSKDKFRCVPLYSVFSELNRTEKEQKDSVKYGYELQAISISDSIFPEEVKDLNLKEKYASLWARFIEEFAKIKCTDSSNLIYSTYHLLKKYTWYIPASTVDYPNSSLFEHMKTTGAFAQVFADYFQENKDSFTYSKGGRIGVKTGYYPVLMLCGDISGIQSFIYSITNKAAMKSLKGRSFYVQLLAETVCDELLQRCGVTIVNQVYAAGGKFYILLPNTEIVKKAIAQYTIEIQQKLWNEYQGKISINFASLAFTMVKSKQDAKSKTSLHALIENETNPVPIGELWNKLVNKAADYRRIKFNNIILNNFDSMFSAHGKGGNTEVCAVTGVEISQKSKRISGKLYGEQNVEETDQLLVDESVSQHVEIGKDLYNANYLINHNKYNDGFKMGISNSWDLINKVNEGEHSINKWINIQFDKEPILFPERQLETHSGVGFKFYGGLPMPTFGSKISTLEELCLIDIPTDKKTKLGVLRMDVDNLGSLFQKGFDSEQSSFSKLATLSALLEQFFSGYINTIRSQSNYKEYVSIVYSGGDDVFAVGRWDKLIDFGIEVREKFRAFVGNRDDITLSAGIAIVGSKFPIAKAAELAGDAEHHAKNDKLTIGKNEFSKNAFNIFNVTVNFTEEMPFVKTLKNDFVQWISEETLSKGLLMKLLEYYDLYKQNKIDWRWQSAYTISRFQKEAKTDVKKAVYEQIKTLLFINEYKEFKNVRFEAIAVACRWAEMEMKIK